MSLAATFTDAIVRRPAQSVVRGLRASDGPDPTYVGVRDEHAAYATALVNAGVAVTLLSALEAFPDSIFVEDPALVFTEGAILLRPGAPARADEVDHLKPILKEKFETVLTLDEGSADGGDILTTTEKIMIGLSARTDSKGAAALARLAERIGRRVEIVETPKDVLHFKTDCALLDDETVLSTKRLAASSVFKDFRVLLTPDGEEAAANALRVNDVLFVGAHFERTIEMLDRAGYRIVPLPVREIGRIDAGLSCMSLRWRA